MQPVHSSDENPSPESRSDSPVDIVDSQRESERSPFFKRISTENPFYLISAACVIHSTGLSMGEGLPLSVMISLIGGYLLLLAVIGIGIVRFWRVWDDARSIFLTLILLMLELSICFDQSIALHSKSAIVGLVGLTLGAMCLVELILRVLKIRLPWIYRFPFYLQLGLAMLASLIPMAFSNSAESSVVRWAIYGVSGLAGLSMLTLIPAIRTSRDRVEFAGCPWIWPFHPWSLFVIVWVCLGFRLYLLTLSFDPAFELSANAAYAGMGGIFGGYLLVPMLLGMSWLLLEAALVHRHWLIQTFALSLPFVCVGLSVEQRSLNPAMESFLAEYSQHIGAPVWLASLASVLYFAVAWWRGLPFARRGLVVSMLLVSVVNSKRVTFEGVEEINLIWLTATAIFLCLVGYQKQKSRFYIEAAMWMVLGLGSRNYFDGWELSPVEIQFHLVAFAIGIVSLWSKDEAMEEFKVLLVLFMVIASVRMVFHGMIGIRPAGFASGYLLLMAVAAYLLSRIHPKAGFLGTACFVFACAYASAFTEGGRYLNHQVRWDGLRQFLIGLGFLHLGLFASAWKGGVFKRWAARFVTAEPSPEESLGPSPELSGE
ncbi:hypothetical protein [Thalassoglobus sp.]|uniref:hypothetical protein n=1 Tax=Thalassoglobus sp. TaxID=2795869 RepID=UPI003AA82485